MNFANCRFCGVWMLAALLLLMASSAFAQDKSAPPPNGTIIPMPNRLQNADFECGDGGYYESLDSRGKPILLPNQWTLAANGDVPTISSARIFFEKKADPQNGGCATRKAHVEKMSGEDSVLVRAFDLETPPEPGKPFDVSLWQQVDAISGTAYSLSGWLLTLCGGSNTVPKNDCPQDYYMAKLLGIDPAGGTDPNASTVVWAENRDNFVDSNNQRIGWSNVRTSATAANDKLTVFARINSPFQWHGNHGFIDALDLVQAPTAALTVVTTTVDAKSLTLHWDGDLGPDIPTIDGGNFHLYFDVQYWHARNGAWRDLQTGATQPGEMPFATRCTNDTYHFRARARAEQPEGIPGVSPNQRFPGVWGEPVDVFVPAPQGPPPEPAGSERAFLPIIHAVEGC